MPIDILDANVPFRDTRTEFLRYTAHAAAGRAPFQASLPRVAPSP